MDYYPWTARLISGKVLSQRENHTLTFASVAPVIDQVLTFTLHFPRQNFGINLSDGQFQLHDYRVFHPKHIVGAAHYRLVYSRRMEATFEGGRLTTRLVGYTLGYKTDKATRTVFIAPHATITWQP